MKIGLFSWVLLAATWGCESKAPEPATSTSAAVPMPAAETSPGLQVVRVEVGNHGFRPSRVSVGANRTLVFRRTTDKTCATAVVFPALGIEKPLPLNTDVTVELPATLNEEVAFQRGMGMLHGKVVAR
jgi:plastocyanin domain-containing protein